jgi:hypothetical protein
MVQDCGGRRACEATIEAAHARHVLVWSSGRIEPPRKRREGIVSEYDNNEYDENASNVHKTPDSDLPIRYVRIINKFRKMILRGRHWFCKDDGKPQTLWSLATPFDMEVADEIESLRQQLAEARAECERLREMLAAQHPESWAKITKRLTDERDGLRDEVGRLHVALQSLADWCDNKPSSIATHVHNTCNQFISASESRLEAAAAGGP